MRAIPGIPSPACGRFEAYSEGDIICGLEACEPNMRWKILKMGRARAFAYGRQDLPSGSITAGEHSVALEAYTRRGGATISLVFVLAGEIVVTVRGGQRPLHISAGRVASFRDFPGRRMTISEGSSWLAFHIAEAKLRHHFESSTGHPYLQEFALSPTAFHEGDGNGLYTTLRGAFDDLNCASLGEKAILAAAYEQMALVKLFTKLPHNLADAFGCPSQCAAPRVLLKAEEYMRRNLSEPVTLEDLATAAACSPRTLQRLFLRYRGKSPLGILCDLRLASAHSALQSGQATTIAELAMSLQFFNPGRFSVLYKRAYGLSPSSSLRYARNVDIVSLNETL